MPASVPHVEEVGATSAPLKSAAFFLGAYCKEYNGSFVSVLQDCAINENFYLYIEDFMLCKNENRSPAHCLKEGRKVTRCAIDL
jgi:NADH dehydrogenase (ubiquinone) 1 alpha subcomplex subunit 8